MTSTVFKSALTALALSALAALAQAQPSPAPAGGIADAHGSVATPKVDARQTRQQARIAHGVANGSLTAHEQHRLRQEQRLIHRAERHAKADGVVTTHERHHLGRLQDRASRHIHRQKHDTQRAGA